MPVKIFNTSIAKTFHDRMNVRDGVFIANELAQNKPVPVIEVDKPIITIVKPGSTVNSTTSTIYTTPSDKDFYLTGVNLTMIKDSTATATLMGVNVLIDATTVSILRIRGLTLTADKQTVSSNFSFPIKIDRGTNITLTSDTADANVSLSCVIFGFISDTLRY